MTQGLDCGTTHYAGCACHEGKRNQEVYDLQQEIARLKATTERGQIWNECVKLRAELDAACEALQFYAATETYWEIRVGGATLRENKGNRARETLERLGKAKP